MTRSDSDVVNQPRTDDRPLYDALLGGFIYQALLVAHDLKLFALLSAKPATVSEISQALGIAPRPAEALLKLSAALGLATQEAGRYSLTPLAEDYLLETSPTYFGAALDLNIANNSLVSFEKLKRAVLTNSPQAYEGGDIFQSHEKQADLARAFTRAMHSSSVAPSLAWPPKLDLSSYRLLLDIGGGSGAHAIAATTTWPALNAIVFDIPPVCDVAGEFIAARNLQARIAVHRGDFWSDPFPAADVHFYSQIYHDWPLEKCRFLTRKSFESLASGGRIVIHEMLFDDAAARPLAAAAYSIAMLLWTEGKQYSIEELSAILEEAGFREVEATPTFGYFSIIIGLRP